MLLCNLRFRKARLLSGALTLIFCIGPALADGTYIVKSGDTLSLIAQRFSVSLDELISLNGITKPDRIDVGQEVKLPDSAVMPEETATASDTPTDSAAEATEPSLTARELLEQRNRLLNEQRKQQGEQLASAAQAFTGTPYRWGGLSSRGIDCSGLVVRVMALQGKRVPHSAAALYNMGVPVTYSELQPGDLVFFNTMGNGVSHVGIWAGENKFTHASSSRGVVTEELVGYFSKRLVGARRIN